MFLLANTNYFTFRFDFDSGRISVRGGSDSRYACIVENTGLLDYSSFLCGNSREEYLIFVYYFLKFNDDMFCGNIFTKEKVGEYMEVTLDSLYYETNVINIGTKQFRLFIKDGVMYFADEKTAFKCVNSEIFSRDRLIISYIQVKTDTLLVETYFDSSSSRFKFYFNLLDDGSFDISYKRGSAWSKAKKLQICDINEVLFNG